MRTDLVAGARPAWPVSSAGCREVLHSSLDCRTPDEYEARIHHHKAAHAA